MLNLKYVVKRVTAFLCSQHYVLLVAKLCRKSKTPVQPASPNLMGSIKIKTDNLEAASQRIADSFAKSRDETVAKL